MEALKEDAMFGPEDAQMLDRAIELIRDDMLYVDGYTEVDEETLKRLERLRDACRTEGLICAVLVLVTPPQTEPVAPEDDETECRDRDGHTYPEHDYDDFQCRRCGAEPDDLPE